MGTETCLTAEVPLGALSIIVLFDNDMTVTDVPYLSVTYVCLYTPQTPLGSRGEMRRARFARAEGVGLPEGEARAAKRSQGIMQNQFLLSSVEKELALWQLAE